MGGGNQIYGGGLSNDYGYQCDKCGRSWSPEIYGRRCPSGCDSTGADPHGSGPQYGPDDRDQYVHGIEHRFLGWTHAPETPWKPAYQQEIHVACQNNMAITSTKLQYVEEADPWTHEPITCPSCIQVRKYNGS